jgi:Ca2+-dependent lipid-binding protein
MKLTRLTRLRVAKYTINIGAYVALATIGVFTRLPEGALLFILQPPQDAQWTLNTNAVLPIVFCLFGAFAIFKDQIRDYFHFPPGINVAILLFILGFIGWLISYWLMAVTGLYLVLTIINTLYFNPALTEELEFRKEEKKEKRKKEREDHA